MKNGKKDKMSVVVLCTDERDSRRAEHTIHQIRTRGRWVGELAWVAVGFEPRREFVSEWRVRVLRRPAVDTSWLWELRRHHPFRGTDGRETGKLIQFSKWRVFDRTFKAYRSLLYIDAGMRINHPIAPIFRIPHKGKIVAPDDRFPFDDPAKDFRGQWDRESMPVRHSELERCYGNVLDRKAYFLNCVWLMDTTLIQPDTQACLLGLARRFPISRTNEMAVMNLHFADAWSPLPEKLEDGLRIFDWTERDGRKTEEHVMVKYSNQP